MAPQSVYTLRDIQTYIDQKFPQASKFITDKKNYTFYNSRNRRITRATSTDRLQLTMRTPSFSGIQAMFESESDTVRYYFGGREEHLVTKEYPLTYRFSIGEHEAPFRFIAPHKWEECSTEEKTLLRIKTRDQLSLLVQFAFLLTGRIDQIRSNDERDLLMEFEKICPSIEKGLQADEKRRIREAQQRREIEEFSDDFEVAEAKELDTPEMTKTLKAGVSEHVSASGSKRVVSSDDETPEIISERSMYSLFSEDTFNTYR